MTKEQLREMFKYNQFKLRIIDEKYGRAQYNLMLYNAILHSIILDSAK